MAEVKDQGTEESKKDGASGNSPELPSINISERGMADGKPVSLNRRLFMQFNAFDDCFDLPEIIELMEEEQPQAVLYQDLNNPTGIGLMTYCEDPAYIVDTIHPLLASDEFDDLEYSPDYTMLGRTYSIGYESDLEDILLHRPIKRICDPETPWCVWYPVRRDGSFERQSREDQRKMLMEHGGIGHAFGKAGYATDVRLAGHGLNMEDNDFIIGLLGKELFPLSALVQRMRQTRQTSEFIENMGPFFVGRAVWQPTPELKR